MKFGQILKEYIYGLWRLLPLNCAHLGNSWMRLSNESWIRVGKIIRGLGVAALALVVLGSTPLEVRAEPLKESLELLLKTHKRLLAADADQKKAEEEAEAAWKDWFPNFSATANYGYEKQDKPTGTVDTSLHPRNLEFSLTQKVWDFGETNANIRRAKLAHDKATLTRKSSEQAVLLEGIQAHLGIIRDQKLLEFAESSAANIKRQADLENERVLRGSGLSTDVLQAKTQLAGANARAIGIKGALKRSFNRYVAVFGHKPEDPETMREPKLPLELLPTSVGSAISMALKGNPQLAATQLDSHIARETTKATRASEFFPSFEASAENNYIEDGAGTIGRKQERLIKLEATYELSLGLTAINTLRAAKLGHLSANNTYANTRDLVEEQAHNTWDDLETQRITAELKHNQANIAAEFLTLARKERQLGNRSLNDVLAAETALINASSDAAQADTDVAISVYRLLSVLGKLAPSIIN